MADFASEGGHYYMPDGTPYYTMVGANGRERNVTLRDARKVGAFPSVTGILKCADKPALTQYFVKQAVMASLTLPRNPGESDDDYIKRILTDSRQEGADARDVGTEIHGAIESAFSERGLWANQPYYAWAEKAMDTVPQSQTWSAEKSFASPLGYGGKVDLHCDKWVIDIKTKSGPAEGRKLWDEEICQLAAYRVGLRLPNARCAILHVDRDNPSAELLEAKEEDLQRGWQMFLSLLCYWQAKNSYGPTAEKIAA